jgi:hypothetical protein
MLKNDKDVKVGVTIAETTEGVDKLIDLTAIISSLDLTKPFAGISEIISQMNDNFGPSGILGAVKKLDEEASSLVRTFGVSKERAGELTSTISKAIPMFVSFGATVEDASLTLGEVGTAFGSNVSLSAESLASLKATSIVTGVSVKDLANNFRDVGVGIGDVGTRMLEVTMIARQSGALVSAVSDGVIKNLDKMNIYNFEGGTKGLAKMAAQASKLGINMDSVFVTIGKAFNPETAIDMAASLQRLGVASSELLDPLRLMDLAQNDPTELQNQIVNLSKEFTVFNKQNNQFEILPGAKRRLIEIGDAMGLPAGEIQKMAINAGNLEYKMKQIKFSPDIKDEDRELVATMSQIGANGKASVMIEKMDEEGKGTGHYFEKLTSELSSKDVENLAKQQLGQQMSMEDIARNQLDELKKTSSGINQIVASGKFGVAASKSVQGAYKGALGGIQEKLIGNVPDEFKNTETYGEFVDKMAKDITGLFNSSFADILTKTTDFAKTAMGKVTSVFGIGGGEGMEDEQTAINTQKINPNTALTKVLSEGNGNMGTSSSTPLKLEILHTFDFTNLPSNANIEDVKKVATTSITEWAKDPINANALAMMAKKINSGL